MKASCRRTTALLLVAAMTFLVSRPGTADDGYQTFFDDHCISCHAGNDAEANLDLSDFSFDRNRNPDDPQSIHHEMTWIEIHDRVRAGEMPPSDAEELSEAVRADFVGRLESQLHQRSLARQEREGRSRARRLNRDEYQNTIRDLLGVHRDYRTLLPADGRVLGFDKVAGALDISAEHLEAYMAVADAALEEAFDGQSSGTSSSGTPSPGIKKRIPQRLADLERLQRVFRHQFTEANDGALVFFSDHWDNITGFTARRAGRYRFRVRARAFQSDQPVKARLRAGMDNEASRRLLDYTEFSPAGSEFELTTWLEPRETLHICPIGTAPRARNLTIHRVPLKRENPASQYHGPGLALEWVEVEGPLLDNRFVATYLDGIDLNAGERKDAETLLRRFLPAAFRRPVRPGEVEHFLQLYDSSANERGFSRGLKTALKSVLCSPHFLFLHSPPGPLDSFALASRLSYFLWNSMPDAELLELASQGELGKPEILAGQVERLLRDPRAEAFRESFPGQWLQLRQIDDTTPDPELYPEFDELLAWSSVKETRAFFDELLAEDLSLLNFVDSEFAMLNERLAQHYGIPGVEGIAFRKVSLPQGSVRGGLLGQASILKVTANGTTTSPILRGVWVMDRILGKTPPPPPENVPALEPDIRGSSTIREQLVKHRADSACAACHARIDPPGFALECFDVIGGYRESYRAPRDDAENVVSVAQPLYIHVRQMFREPASPESSQASVGIGPSVDSSNEYEGKPFADVREFRTLLLSDQEQLARAFLSKLITYATGSGIQFADRRELDAMVHRLQSRGLGVRCSIHEIVQSPIFLRQ